MSGFILGSRDYMHIRVLSGDIILGGGGGGGGNMSSWGGNIPWSPPPPPDKTLHIQYVRGCGGLCICAQGLECLCSSGECMFLVLPSSRERNWLYDAILAQPQVHLNQDSLEEATLSWMRGDMTNYQYLMLLNLSVIQ